MKSILNTKLTPTKSCMRLARLFSNRPSRLVIASIVDSEQAGDQAMTVEVDLRENVFGDGGCTAHALTNIKVFRSVGVAKKALNKAGEIIYNLG